MTATGHVVSFWVARSFLRLWSGPVRALERSAGPLRSGFSARRCQRLICLFHFAGPLASTLGRDLSLIGTIGVGRLGGRLTELRPCIHQLAPLVWRIAAAAGGFGLVADHVMAMRRAAQRPPWIAALWWSGVTLLGATVPNRGAPALFASAM